MEAALLVALVLSGPTVVGLELHESPKTIDLVFKLRERVIPDLEQWWQGGYYKVRITKGRFSSRLKVRKGQDSQGIVTFERRYDPKGATVRLRFKFPKEKVVPALVVDTYKGGLKISIDKVQLGFVPPPEDKEKPAPMEPQAPARPAPSKPAGSASGVPVAGASGMAPAPMKGKASEPSAVPPMKSGSKKGATKAGILGEEVKKALREGGEKGAPAGSSAGGWGTTLVLLLILGAIAAGAYYLMRRLQGGGRGSEEIKVVARATIGPGLQVVVVDVMGRRLVIGVSGGQMSLLTELGEEIPVVEDMVVAEEDGQGVVPESIQGILKLKKEKGKGMPAKPPIEGEYFQGAGLEDDDE